MPVNSGDQGCCDMKGMSPRDPTFNPEKENYKDRWMRKHQKHHHHDDMDQDEDRPRPHRPRCDYEEDDDSLET